MPSTDGPRKTFAFVLNLSNILRSSPPEIIESPATKTVFFDRLCVFEVRKASEGISALREDSSAFGFSFHILCTDACMYLFAIIKKSLVCNTI